ncbi:Nitrous oxide reductase maturation protein NosR [Alteromonas stellipolaris LMG 21856]|nr:Nitrous oxide reductase maturation protein NosR [Alteromonas stellipolaris LMG 21856]
MLPYFVMLKALLFLFVAITSISLVFAQSDATEIPEEVHRIFPTATRVGAEHADINVTPVYQLQQLLGYVFESKNFVDFIGFSGKPVNVLIGLDTQGNFVDLTIKKHSEPIFLHGLGEQSLRDFIAQYKNHNVKERFVVGGKSHVGKNATYFDGVTKATVSVLVINDTIVTSALAVARAKLDGFVVPSSRIINPDYFEALTFEQLVKAGYIQKQTIYRNELDGLATEIVDAANTFSDPQVPLFSEHYYGFLSIPVVGKNLLSNDEYARLQESLKPGEVALFIINTHGFSFVSDEFIPQTAPEFFRLSQSAFTIDARDLDFYSFYDPSFKQPIPEFKTIKILRIKSQGGLSLDQEMTASISLPFSPRFMEQDEHLFNHTFLLPDVLFMENSEAQQSTAMPLWQQLWKSRWLELSITITYLIVLSLFFGFQRKLMKYTRMVHAVRGASLLFVLFFIGIYAQGQLSVVNIYTLLLDLADGFSIEVYLLDPVIFVLWCFVFVSLFIVGRGLYCGWLCPFGALQEVMAVVAQKLKIRQIRIKPKHHKYAQKLKYVVLVVLVATSFYSLTLAEKLAEIEPFKTSITLYFVRYWPFVLYALLLLGLSLKIHKVYCRYLCPLGAGLAILGRFPLVKLLERRKECGNPCQLCKQKKCGVDAIEQDGSIDYAECVQCFECVVTLDNPNLCKIDKYKKNKVPTRVKNFHPVRAE